MSKIEAMLMFARSNNLPAIWKSKVTGNDLAAEVGELSEFDRRNIEVFDKYRAGNGTVKSFDVVKALTRLAPKAEQRAAIVRGEILEHVLGIPQSAPSKNLAPSLRANTLADKIYHHPTLEAQRNVLKEREERQRQHRQQQRFELLARRYEALTGCSSRDVTPAEQLDVVKELEAKLDKRSRRAA